MVGDPQPCPAIGLNQAGSRKDLLGTKSFQPRVLRESRTIQKHLAVFNELSKPIESVDRLKIKKEEERRMNSLRDEGVNDPWACLSYALSSRPHVIS